MTIKTFSKPVTKALAAEIEAALQGVAAKHGISICYAGGTLLGDNKVVLKIALESQDPDALRSEFEKVAPIFNLTVADYGKVLTVNGREMRLVGFDLKRRKFPLKMQAVADGTIFGLTEAIIPRIKAAAPAQ
jgi:hypothetical protein